MSNATDRANMCLSVRASLVVLTTAVVAFVLLPKLAQAVDRDTFAACKVSTDDAVGLHGDTATNVRAIRDYEDAVRNILKETKFDQLDCLADSARLGKERFSGGTWKIHIIYEALSTPLPETLHPTQSDWSALLQNLEQWVSAKPASVTAHVALARAYMEYAWFVRGSGYSNTVSQNGWRQFEDYTAQAKRMLEEANSLSSKCPEWFNVMMMVAQAEGWSVDRTRALFDEAMKFEPRYYYYSRGFANVLLPQWHGEEGDSERFAQDVADHVGGDEGNFLYFEIASYLICGCPNEPKMSSTRIVKGFEASEKLYGPSLLNLNLIAKITSRFTDLDAVTANKAFIRIGDQWDETSWKTKEDFDSIRGWIAAYAPAAAKRREMEDMAEANARTAEGSRYQMAFTKTYKKIVNKCAEADGNDLDDPETLTSIGAQGTVEEMKIYSQSAMGMCIYQKLQAFKQGNIKAFPVPPQAPFWVRLDLKKADFKDIAAK